MNTWLNHLCLFQQSQLPLAPSPSLRSRLITWHFTGLHRSPYLACWKSTTSLHSCFPLFAIPTSQPLHSRPQRTIWPQTVWTLTSQCQWMLQIAARRTPTASHSSPWTNTDTTASKWLLWPTLESENIHTGVMHAPSLEVRDITVIIWRVCVASAGVGRVASLSQWQCVSGGIILSLHVIV